MPRPIKRVEIRGAYHAIVGDVDRGIERWGAGYPSYALPDGGPLSEYLHELMFDTWEIHEDWVHSDGGRIEFSIVRGGQNFKLPRP